MSTVPVLSPSAAEPTAAIRQRRIRWLKPGALAEGVQSHAVYALADQVVYSFGNMVIAALISRRCAAAQFGVYILTQRVMDVLIQLSNVFLWAPYTFRHPGMGEARRRFYQGSIVFFQFIFALIFAGTLYVASHWVTAPRHRELHDTFEPLVLASGAILFREFNRRMYFAHMRMKEAFWTELITVLLQILGVGWLFATGQLSVSTALTALSLAAGAVSLWWLVREWNSWHIQFADVFPDFRDDLRLGRWFFGSNMLFLAGAQCNPWVLEGVLGGFSVGAYAVAESLVNIPRVALTSMQNMMAPMLARAHAEGGVQSVRKLVQRFNGLLLLSSSVFAAAVWLWGPFLARAIYKTSFAETRQTAFWLAINLVVYACTLAQSYGLTVLNRADAPFYANAAGLVAQASCCIWLIREFHVPGAAMSLLIGSAATVVVRQRIYKRELATL